MSHLAEVLPYSTPLLIELMLHCYTSPNPRLRYDDAQWNNAPLRDAREWLISRDCIEPDTHRATDRGKAWVEHICETPLPVKQWMRPEYARKLAEY